MIRFGIENVKRNENNEGKGTGTLLVLRVNLRMMISVCLKNLSMQYKNSDEKSYARRWSIVRPPNSLDSTRPDLSVWETVKKTACVQGPKDSYDLTANIVATFTQITPEIVSANRKIWPPDMNYIQKEDHVEG
jgi:hypothetical protein